MSQYRIDINGSALTVNDALIIAGPECAAAIDQNDTIVLYQSGRQMLRMNVQDILSISGTDYDPGTSIDTIFADLETLIGSIASSGGGGGTPSGPAGGSLTGTYPNPTIASIPSSATGTTQSAGDNSTKLATTAFVKSQSYLVATKLQFTGIIFTTVDLSTGTRTFTIPTGLTEVLSVTLQDATSSGLAIEFAFVYDIFISTDTVLTIRVWTSGGSPPVGAYNVTVLLQ